jgi:RNA-splicing ligase RtcB
MSKEQVISGRDLLAAGVPEGRGFAEELEFARMEISKGVKWETVSQRLAERARGRKGSVSKIMLRGELEVMVASQPDTPEEQENINKALVKMRELTRVPVVTEAALMPDTCPSGNEWGAVPVGGVVVTRNSIIPGAHSADVNCGMYASFFDGRANVKDLMSALGKSTFFGPFPVPAGEENPSPILNENVWSNPFLRGLEKEALIYLGTQGDGNHFSYLGKIIISHSLVKNLEKGGHESLAQQLSPHRGDSLWTLVTHHGSRNFGAKVYRRGMKEAEKHTSSIASGIPKNVAWLDLDTQTGRDYWEALEYVGRWTLENHQTIHRKFLAHAGVRLVANLSNHHNAVWKRPTGIFHGKGATPAWRENGIPHLGIIPLNMGSEILLVEGADNKDFLSFAPHGAGRNRSRKATKEAFYNPATGDLDPSLVDQSLKEQLNNISVEWASGTPDISESPLGYKSASKVRAEIEEFGLAKILAEVSPSGCMMAGEFKTGRDQRVAGFCLGRGSSLNQTPAGFAREGRRR